MMLKPRCGVCKYAQAMQLCTGVHAPPLSGPVLHARTALLSQLSPKDNADCPSHGAYEAHTHASSHKRGISPTPYPIRSPTPWAGWRWRCLNGRHS
eukprot:352915-Chlamydomonas_euryale.AAC.11